MDGFAAHDPRHWADRRPDWYDRRPSGTDGGAARTSGVGRAYLAIAAFIVAGDSVNVLSNLYEAARSNRTPPAWIPLTDEFTSGTAMLLASGLVYLALRLAPPDRGPWLLKVPAHAATTVIFSAVHVAIMMSLRILVFAAHGRAYHLPVPSDWLYEYRKDVLSYSIIAGMFWLFKSPALSEAPRAAEQEQRVATATPGRATFDIVDGTRTLRVPADHILAVRAVHNYVEFLLEDGRAPLMRASLSRIEAALAAHGLVRTHRSWLVNPSRLRSLEATGAGDYRLGLDGGVQVPLSRRFPAALERLRRGE